MIPMMRIELLACVLTLSAACRTSGQAEDENASPTDDETSEGGETGFPIPDSCSSAMPCEAGYCVAAWDANAEPPRGPAECVPTCVGELDLQRFCIVDASCCAGLECSLDGLCEPPFEPDTDSGSGSDSETDSGSDSGSETDSGTGTDTDTDTSSDSGTDTDTGTT